MSSVRGNERNDVRERAPAHAPRAWRRPKTRARDTHAHARRRANTSEGDTNDTTQTRSNELTRRGRSRGGPQGPSQASRSLERRISPRTSLAHCGNIGAPTTADKLKTKSRRRERGYNITRIRSVRALRAQHTQDLQRKARVAGHRSREDGAVDALDLSVHEIGNHGGERRAVRHIRVQWNGSQHRR